VKASDKKRLSEMEKEMTDCFIDRYVGDLPEFYAQNPEVGDIREELFQYLDGRPVSYQIPTYYHYWEDEESRQRLWCIERDPIARGIMHRLNRTSRDFIDGRNVRRLKRVGDGSHIAIEDDSTSSSPSSRELGAEE
jgi:hypothetical protein